MIQVIFDNGLQTIRCDNNCTVRPHLSPTLNKASQPDG